MNPYWWIPIVAAALLIGVLILGKLSDARHAGRCWWCGAGRGEPHKPGCAAERPL
jgi:hypothetical protein